MKPHKHCKEIKAWADGAQIQKEVPKGGNSEAWLDYEWVDEPNPSWNSDANFRIKPREFEEGAWYPAVRQCGSYIIQFEGEKFWSGHLAYLFEDFNWIGDKLEIDWPEAK